MKKITFLMSFLLLLSWQGMAQSFSAGACPTGIAIPDNTPIGVTDTITVSGAGTALGTDILLEQVNLHITHTWGNDLDVFLTSPNGVTVELTTDNGGSGRQYGDDCANYTSFNMSALASITTGTANFVGSFIPEGTFVDFNDASSANGEWYITVSDDAGGDTGNLEFVELVFAAPPACPAPTTLVVNNITSTGADLGWAENGSATTWDIEWDTTGFTPGLGNMITGTTTNPHNLSGLTANTSYSYYVRADCGGANGASAWVGPFTFTTIPDYCAGDHFYDNGGATGDYSNNVVDETTVICASTPGDVITATFNSFDTEAGWDDLTVFNGNGTGGTSFGTFDGTTIPGPFVSTDASGCLTFVFNSDGSGQRAGWDATITCSPAPSCLVPSALTVTNIDGFSADLGWTENGTATSWDIEWDTTGFTPGTGNMVTGTMTNPHNISGLTPETSYQFYVRADCGGANGTSTWAGPFSFTTTVSCQAPSNINALMVNATDALIGWAENGSATSWDIEWGNAGFALGTGTADITSTNPYLTTPLMPETPYDFYVRSICGAGDTSVWVGPFTFMTPCIATPVTAFPWTEDFDSETTPNMPCGWIVDNVNADAYTWETGTNQPNSGANAMQVRWNSAEAANDWAFTPELQMTGGITYQLSFAFSVAGGTFPEKLKVMYGAGQNVAGMTDLLFDSTMTNTSYETATILFTPPTTGSYYVGFHNYSDANMFRVYVDDVTIDIATAVEDNMVANNISIYPNPTTGIFTIAGDVKNANVNVMSITGEVVYQNNISGNNTTIDLSNNAKGLYFVSISTEKGTETYKVVIQ
jgi:subtilisin-like proprotein convertase family protein